MQGAPGEKSKLKKKSKMALGPNPKKLPVEQNFTCFSYAIQTRTKSIANSLLPPREPAQACQQYKQVCSCYFHKMPERPSC